MREPNRHKNLPIRQYLLSNFFYYDKVTLYFRKENDKMRKFTKIFALMIACIMILTVFS